MADFVYPNFKKDVEAGVIDLDTDTFWMMLTTSTYTPANTDHFRSDVTNEVTGTGYTSGGQTIGAGTLTISTTTVKWTANATVTWAASTITARRAVVYKRRGGLASADELCLAFDFVTDQSSSAGNFIVTFNANGLLVTS
jgi:hypothetical protein